MRALHHRLYQPLTALSCALEVMQMGREQDYRLTEQIQFAMVQSEKIGELMGMFRQLFEAAAPAARYHAVSLSRLLREVVEDMSPLADSHHVSLHLEEDDANQMVNIAQQALRQTLWGIIQNCIDIAPPRGNISITRRGTQVVICDACGCTGTEIENTFDPFSYTANRSTGGNVSNLPLAVAQSLVVAAGGEMSVAGNNQGRCFILILLTAQP